MKKPKNFYKMEADIKRESLQQHLDLLEWSKHCPPLDLNLYALGVSDIIERSMIKSDIIKSYRQILLAATELMNEKNKKLAEEFINGADERLKAVIW